MDEEKVRSYRAYLENNRDEIFSRARDLGIKGIEHLYNWFFQMIALASAALIAAAGLMTKTGPDVCLPFVYGGLALSAWSLLQAMWFLKHRVEEDVNQLAKRCEMMTQFVELKWDSEADRTRMWDIYEDIQKCKETQLVSYSTDIVAWVVTASVVSLILAVLIPALPKLMVCLC